MKFKKTALTVALSLGLVAAATNASAVDYVSSITSPISIPGYYTGGQSHGFGETFSDRVLFSVSQLFTIGGQISNTFNAGGLDLDLTSVTLKYDANNTPLNTADDVLIATLAGTNKFRSGTGTFTTPGDYYYTINGVTGGTYGGTYSWQVNTLPVPEPESYAMLLVGLGLMGAIARRRKSSAV